MTRALAIALFLAACAPRPPLVPPSSSSKQPAAVSPMRACASSAECVVVATPSACCGDCGNPRRGHARALGLEWVSEHGVPGCDGVGCPRCHAPPDPTLLATCSRGACTLVDLARHRVTRCARDADCVRVPAPCCECGADTVVAVNVREQDRYRALACGAPTRTCPACATPLPQGPVACVAGHCTIPARGSTGMLDDLGGPR